MCRKRGKGKREKERERKKERKKSERQLVKVFCKYDRYKQCVTLQMT